MLVLSRKKGESVVVNGNITIVVVDVRGDKARLGIEAPADVAVYRSEILTKNSATNEGESAKSEGGNAVAAEAKKAARKTKNVGETSKRWKTGGARGAKNGSDAALVEKDGDPVEALYLSNETEAYRRFETSERPEQIAQSAQSAPNVELEFDASNPVRMNKIEE